MHVDPPKDPKDYLHRAGRTARAGESGAVVTLVLPKQRRTTASMMLKAGVTPAELRVRLGDEQLANVTGAREPSGVPVKIEPDPRERGDRPRRFGDRPQRGGYGDRPRSGGSGSSYGDRPRTGGERSFGDRPRGNFSGGTGGGERSYGDRPRGGEQRSYGDRDRSFGDRPRGEQRTYADRPSGDRSYADRPATGGERPTGDRTFADRQRGFGDRTARNLGERPAGFRREPSRNDRRETGNGRFSTGRPAHTH
jgi:superfamily II DNA/RNA helicase